MNLMFTGRLETSVPSVGFFDGAFTIIRPLIYIPEQELARYRGLAGFSTPPECPHASNTTRAQMGDPMRRFERQGHQVRANLWRTARQAMGF